MVAFADGGSSPVEIVDHLRRLAGRALLAIPMKDSGYPQMP
jgi:hypothetical protein